VTPCSTRAAWSLALLPASEDQVVGVARLVLALRDDVADAADRRVGV
jgi:hypothetical protein